MCVREREREGGRGRVRETVTDIETHKQTDRQTDSRLRDTRQVEMSNRYRDTTKVESDIDIDTERENKRYINLNTFETSDRDSRAGEK